MSPIKLPALPFDQPAGSFLLTVMNAAQIILIAKATPREYDPKEMSTKGGVQRDLSDSRVIEIAKYANTTDAAFPTPILLALPPKSYKLTKDGFIEIQEGCQADIVDGQHRIRGLEKSGVAEKFSIPVVFILDAIEEQKALLFATVNGKQTKVPASLIYDLFGVTESRSPEKTSHEVARAMNQSPESAWHGKLKMLGKRSPDGEETLSQGTFVKELLPMISPDPMSDRDLIRRGKQPKDHPECPLNEFFVKDKDSVILRILMNAFGAAKNTWPAEWDNPDNFILTKSVGFTAIMEALPELIGVGRKESSLTLDFFAAKFKSAKDRLKRDGLELNSTQFSAGAGATKLRKLILEGIGSNVAGTG